MTSHAIIMTWGISLLNVFRLTDLSEVRWMEWPSLYRYRWHSVSDSCATRPL